MSNHSAIRQLSIISVVLLLLTFTIFYSCKKEDGAKGYNINNSLTVFKIDNKNNNLDLSLNDTVSSQAGVKGKYIPVSGAAGASNGLDSLEIDLLTLNDSLLTRMVITSFYKPEYHPFSVQLDIPASQKGNVYKVVVSAFDKGGTEIGTKTFYGVDVVSCDPTPPCLVNNQITVLVETPAGTPENEDISLFGSLNGWNRGDPTYILHKNPDVPNCYCVSVPFPPGYSDWMLGEIFVVRGGVWEKQAVNTDGSDFIVKYTDSDRGPIWKIKVPKWRDQ
jgi:hypothetical protein